MLRGAHHGQLFKSVSIDDKYGGPFLLSVLVTEARDLPALTYQRINSRDNNLNPVSFKGTSYIVWGEYC